jgi:hypothetical protein
VVENPEELSAEVTKCNSCAEILETDESWRPTVDTAPIKSGLDNPEEGLQTMTSSDVHVELMHDDFPMRIANVFDL